MQFVGYIITNERDEFLAAYSRREWGCALAWTLHPDWVQVFKSRREAERIIARESDPGRPLYLGELYDDVHRWIVSAALDSPAPAPVPVPA